MARGLLAHILKHAKAEGWIEPGQVIVDPFFGIGSTGILGAYEGYQVIGVELEQRFVDLAGQNIALHAPNWKVFGNPVPVILQGNSRKLCEVVEKADIVVSSPPFQDSDQRGCQQSKVDLLNACARDGKGHGDKNPARYVGNDYGQTPGQLGAMKPGNIDVILSSPPYAETLKGDGTQSETASESRAKRNTPGGSLGQSQRTQGYGSAGNLGNLKSGKLSLALEVNNGTILSCETDVSTAETKSRDTTGLSKDAGNVSSKVTKQKNSPSNVENPKKTLCASETTPKTIIDGQVETQVGEVRVGLGKDEKPCKETGISASVVGQQSHTCEFTTKRNQKKRAGNGTTRLEISKQSAIPATPKYTDLEHTKDNALKPGDVSAIIASPPWEVCEVISPRSKKFYDNWAKMHGNKQGFACHANSDVGYGETKGQLGSDKGDTFWAAAKQIVQQCHQILKPGGHAIWVVKAFVRKGKRVDFPGDWRRLCESVGLKTVCVHHAMLVKETRHPGFWGEIVETISQKSFFRRLCEAKGSPKIDYEVVICTQKAL